MHIVGKNLVFSVNESKKTIVKGEEKTANNWDAIYIVKNWELASKEITAINTNN